MSKENGEVKLSDEEVKKVMEETWAKMKVPMPACSYCGAYPLPLGHRMLGMGTEGAKLLIVIFFCAHCHHIIPASDFVVLPPEQPLVDGFTS